MRIAVIGAHGTGKSTLAEKLAQVLSKPFIVEQARVALDKGFELDQQADALTQAFIFLLQLEQEQRDDFVSDRSFIDSWVYMQALKENFDDKNQALINQLQRLINYYDLKYYDKLIYVPIEFKLTGDGVRNTDIEFQSKLDELFKDFILKHGLQALRVTGTVEQRLEQAVRYCNEA